MNGDDAAPLHGRTDGGQRRTILAVGGGVAVEYFDWIAYATFAVFFAPLVFPAEDPTASFLGAAAVFATGFLFRPLGGMLNGALADRAGRRVALTVSVTLMTVSTAMLAVMPTYAVAGTWAAVYLLVARAVQGLAFGAEYGPVAASLRELAPPGRRIHFSVVVPVANGIGQATALVVLLVLQLGLPSEIMQGYGWRVPFLLAAVGAIVVGYLRRNLTDSAESRAVRAGEAAAGPRRSGRPVLMVRAIRLPLLLGFLVFASGQAATYVYTVYIQTLAVNTVGLGVTEATSITLAVIAVQVAVQPLVVRASLRWGTGTTLTAALAFLAVAAIPSYLIAIGTRSPVVLLVVGIVMVVPVAVHAGTTTEVVTALLPTRYRGLGAGTLHGTSVALVGGTAPYLALALRRSGIEGAMGFYLAVLAVVGVACMVVAMRREWPGRLDERSEGRTAVS